MPFVRQTLLEETANGCGRFGDPKPKSIYRDQQLVSIFILPPKKKKGFQYIFLVGICFSICFGVHIWKLPPMKTPGNIRDNHKRWAAGTAGTHPSPCKFGAIQKGMHVHEIEIS